MDNIIYIDDYINLYNKKNHKLIITKPYNNTLRNGFIIDKDKFIKKMNKISSKPTALFCKRKSWLRFTFYIL